MPLTGNGRENNGAKRGTRATFGLMQLKSAPSGVFVAIRSQIRFHPLFRKSPSQIISQEFFFLFPSYENLI